MATPLKPLTVKKARELLSNPQNTWVFQSYDLLDINQGPPSLIHSEDKSGVEKSKLQFTGNLKIGRKNSKIIPNWLNTYLGKGPYADPNYPHDFYYLGVKNYEIDWVQICEKNIISTDCLDEVNFWVPVEVGDQVLILLEKEWNNFLIVQMSPYEIYIHPINDQNAMSKLVYDNLSQKTKNLKEKVDGVWKVSGGEDKPYLIWFHSGELDKSFVDKFLSQKSLNTINDFKI